MEKTSHIGKIHVFSWQLAKKPKTSVRTNTWSCSDGGMQSKITPGNAIMKWGRNTKKLKTFKIAESFKILIWEFSRSPNLEHSQNASGSEAVGNKHSTSIQRYKPNVFFGKSFDRGNAAFPAIDGEYSDQYIHVLIEYQKTIYQLTGTLINYGEIDVSLLPYRALERQLMKQHLACEGFKAIAICGIERIRKV